MQENEAKEGGCIQLDSSSRLYATDSSFLNNRADTGGAFFAIAKSSFEIHSSLIAGNYGNDASAVYGMANSDPFALKFYDSVFENNYAE